MEITRDKEIRSLDVEITQRLANFFAGDDSVLSLLMGNIVKDFEDPNSELRFTSTDIDSVRNHAQQMSRSPVLILIDEWGTMGKNRPKVHHLLALLVKCKLFRAADYVARLIGEPSPQRPAAGPAAKVDIRLPDGLESAINGMSYPFSAEEANREKRNVKPNMNVPNLNFEANSGSKVNNITIPFIKPPASNSGPIFRSDLIKFSSRIVSTTPVKAENISQAHSTPPNDPQQSNHIPMTVNSEADIATSAELPAFSRLIPNGHSGNQSQELPAVLSSINNASSNVASNSGLPALSEIFGGDSTTQSFQQSTSESSDTDDSDTNKQ